MPLTDKQREFLKHCNHRWNVKTGATGSGKSFLDYAYVIPRRIMAARGLGLLVLMGNTRGTLERNILEPMRELYPDYISTIRSDNTLTMFGRKVYALGADNKKHVARIQGATFEYAYGDEITTWSEDVFTMLKSRLRTQHSCFDGSCNPDRPQHWFKRFLDTDADIYQQHYTIDDGVLPPDVVAELKKEYAGTVYYNRFILGQWCSAEGACYPLFTADPSRFVRWEPPATVRYVNIGVDFGGGTSGHAFSAVGFTDRMRHMGVVDEYYCKDALDPRRLEERFCEFVRRVGSRYRIADVFCDSAEQTLINGLRVAAEREGLRVNVSNARKKPINDRIRAACRLMATDRFFVLDACPVTIEAYQSAVFDSANLTEDVRLDNGTSNIDTLDATEYAYEREIPLLLEAHGF